MSIDFVTIQEMVQAARHNLNQGTWGYLSGGSESETTLRRNRHAFDTLAFRPRVLVDVSDVDTSGTLLGHALRIPVLLAPIGSQQVFFSEGGAAATRAADEFGILDVISSVTEPSLEDIASTAGNPKVYQLYLNGDWEWVKEMIARVRAAGYAALCITVDTARPSRRDRTLLARWTPRADFLGSVAPSRHQVTGRMGGHASRVTWETIGRIKDEARLPMLLKGIATAEDAALAVEHGIDVVWVSNHGGRQLDHGLATMDVLPEVVEAVGGKAEIVLDGGIQRGSDVMKAIALGANATAVGKLQCWGLAAGGTPGLVRALEILEDEMISSMALLGVTSLAELTPAYVRKAEAVTAPSEMSSWVNMPGGRLL
ncbi:MAG: alpha-hydroxy acid oxidase [Chloroflexota bacterium]|nr:alpha-hydroxy acid oxidase [Chloroflexota bacterium]MDE2941165.1 alpha-hydroxy acid oxidase [Chloroflexota bacterium]MDE3267044.1 alpha-hydroxy acid oxidase [Chloroflexota bacterium]